MNLWYLSRVVMEQTQGEFRAMIVLAHDESEARQLASERAGEEGEEVWLDSETSVCLRDGDSRAHVLARTQ